ncbi:MAG: polysaccharide ABC transporter ATP-binding protein [Fidelibacterota bacterium]
MNNILISIQHISKYFNVNEELQKNFRELLMSRLSLRKYHHRNEDAEKFCALEDISFDMKRGESMGILGRNGAGKSTLLKIIAGITPPTRGAIHINGKLVSILDIGTGFHPDLSGRDNVFLSAALLGMNKQQIKSKFDNIIDFSGISEFIDTPVKHYSSGMYVRLAFAVAAHVDADILLFDEIISVGDAEFKMKCLEKVNELKKAGATILLVSHSFNDIVKFCDKAILMSNGKITSLGDPQEIIIEYVEKILNQSSDGIRRKSKLTSANQDPENFDSTGAIPLVKNWDENDKPPGNDYIKILQISVKSVPVMTGSQLSTDDDIEINIRYKHEKDNSCIDIAFVLLDESLNRIFASSPAITNSTLSSVSVGYFSAVCKIPKNFLNQGLFSLNIIAILNRNEIIYKHQNLFHFRVRLSDIHKNGSLNLTPGPIRPHLQWDVDEIEIPSGQSICRDKLID